MSRSRSPRRDRRRSRSRSRDRRRERDSDRRRDRADEAQSTAPRGQHSRREQPRPPPPPREGEPAGEVDKAWAQRLGDPRYDKGSANKQSESTLWSQKGKAGNLWEARDEEELVLIGTGREEGGDAPMQPVRYEAQGAQSAAVLAMEAVAAELKTKEEAEPVPQEESEEDDVSGEEHSDEDEDGVEKEEVNFGNTGALAAETNMINGVVVKFQVPAEARLPTKRWRLYIFKGDEVIEPLQLHRMNHYLIGRERKVCHIPSDNPSVSSQHAVICFRLVDKTKSAAAVERKMVVVPYLMDLGSVNGTFLNNKRVEPQRFYELLEGDALQFGQSPRKYVLLHEETKMTKRSK